MNMVYRSAMNTTERRQQKQVWFATALRNLRKQGKPSADDDGTCLYRGPDGCRCALGWLIPDDKYTPDMEGCGVSSDLVSRAIPNSIGYGYFLLALQQGLHDNFFEDGRNPRDLSYKEWLEEEAKSFAETFELTYVAAEGASE